MAKTLKDIEKDLNRRYSFLIRNPPKIAVSREKTLTNLSAYRTEMKRIAKIFDILEEDWD